jgi:hypothetical protein
MLLVDIMLTPVLQKPPVFPLGRLNPELEECVVLKYIVL